MLYSIATIARVPAAVTAPRSPETPHSTAPVTNQRDPGESVKTRRKPLSGNKLFLQIEFNCVVRNSIAEVSRLANPFIACLCCRLQVDFLTAEAQRSAEEHAEIEKQKRQNYCTGKTRRRQRTQRQNNNEDDYGCEKAKKRIWYLYYKPLQGLRDLGVLCGERKTSLPEKSVIFRRNSLLSKEVYLQIFSKGRKSECAGDLTRPLLDKSAPGG